MGNFLWPEYLETIISFLEVEIEAFTQCQWLMLVILSTWEAEIRRIVV
jgi:hypothetical protein